MSHGEQGSILDCDGIPVPIQDIINQMNPAFLDGKPKVCKHQYYLWTWRPYQCEIWEVGHTYNIVAPDGFLWRLKIGQIWDSFKIDDQFLKKSQDSELYCFSHLYKILDVQAVHLISFSSCLGTCVGNYYDYDVVCYVFHIHIMTQWYMIPPVI